VPETGSLATQAAARATRPPSQWHTLSVPLSQMSSQRSEVAPDVPTFKEQGFPDVGFDPDVWQAIIAPLGTPAPIVNKLNAEINAALRSNEVQATFKKLRFQPMIHSVEEFAKFLTVQAERWPPIIKAAGLKAQ
jgi:tripartite-type tricarboxylate transporter receptor subunit TctC